MNDDDLKVKIMQVVFDLAVLKRLGAVLKISPFMNRFHLGMSCIYFGRIIYNVKVMTYNSLFGC